MATGLLFVPQVAAAIAASLLGAAIARRFSAKRVYLAGLAAGLYGVCETANGNWSQLDMTRDPGASTTIASLALTMGLLSFAVARPRPCTAQKPSPWGWRVVRREPSSGHPCRPSLERNRS